MKQFLINILFFSLVLISVFSGVFIFSKFIFSYSFHYQIPKEKNILLLGDSHVECAINDSILSQSYNLAQSGTSYFYSYLKLREILKFNPHIDSVCLGYSYHNLFKEWFSQDKYIEKIRIYLPLMGYKDIVDLFIANPGATIYNLPIAIFDNFLLLIKGNRYNIGGHLRLGRNDISELGNLEDEMNRNLIISEYESKYLIAIYNLCKEHNINLILLSTPIHPTLEIKFNKYKSKFYQFKNRYLTNAHLLNHSTFYIMNIGWGDMHHLNGNGSLIYSKYLKLNGFNEINIDNEYLHF